MTAALSSAATQALRLFTAVPDGHRAVQVRRHHPGSAYRRGMFVIVNPADVEPEHGADFLVQWNDITGPNITGVRLIRERWFVGPAGNGHSQMMGNEVVVMVDGPYKADNLRSKLLGRVVGYLGQADGHPIEALWQDLAMEGPNSDTVSADCFPEVYSAVGDGTCLEPIYPDRTRFLMSTLDDPRPGDYVVLYRKPGLTRQSQRQALIKRLVTSLPEGWQPSEQWLQGDPMPAVVLVEAHNPPRTYAVPANELMAVHKCLGSHDGPTFKVTQDEARALAAEQRAARSAA